MVAAGEEYIVAGDMSSVSRSASNAFTLPRCSLSGASPGQSARSVLSRLRGFAVAVLESGASGAHCAATR